MLTLLEKGMYFFYIPSYNAAPIKSVGGRHLKSSKSIISLAVLLATTIIIPVSGAVAGGADEASLPSLVVSATRHEMPQSRVSSDITVITKEDISHLPVHDLSEALNYVTGLDLQRGGGPGTPASPSIQGSDLRHVKILIDGMPIENLSESFPDLSILPLENIERIEVMKGSASSVWGSSLGGVINIITKKPSDKMTAEGGISLGENSTNSYKAGLSGQAGGVGYFLSLSRFETDGFHDFQEAENNYLYVKLTKDINPHLKATATYSFSDINREDSGWEGEEDSFEQRVALALDYKPKEKLEYALLVYDRQYNVRTENPFNGIGRDVEDVYGGTFSSVWRHNEESAFSLGAEASHGDLKLNQMAGWEDFDVEKTALFANEVFGLGRLSLNAGVRYDNDSVFGSEISPSVGGVYRIAETTLFRLNAARGFTPPPVTFRYLGIFPNKDLNAERAWTYQAGVESSAVQGLLGKVTFFRADVDEGVVWESDDNDVDGDGDTWEPLTFRNIKELRRQGVEAELKTNEYKGLSLSYGYAFNHVTRLHSDDSDPGYTYAKIIHNAGIDYKGPYETRTTINGHWVWWNDDSAKDKTWVWDAKVSKYFAKWKYAIGEVFVSVHNITDEDQFWNDFYPNPGRWVEAGLNLTTF